MRSSFNELFQITLNWKRLTKLYKICTLKVTSAKTEGWFYIDYYNEKSYLSSKVLKGTNNPMIPKQ